MPALDRATWGSRLGVILAVAGSAVGLGNFLRFPAQAAQNGGGAFMLPYILSFIFLGLPLMWIEWTMGRYGGGFGHGTAPGIFHSLDNKRRFTKYFGVIGIVGPAVIYMYYVFIESWLLGYAVFSLTPTFRALSSADQIGAYLGWYLGSTWAWVFFLITFTLNSIIILKGLKGGIEKFCTWALPLLFVLAAFLVIRVLTLGAPDPAHPDWTPMAGLKWLWTPDFSVLANSKVWIAAAGQIFFTLSVGLGAILAYSSYLKKNDDVVGSGFKAAMTNEFAEVVLGGSLIIPAAFAFFGPEKILSVASSGTFNIGFVTMPLIFNNISLGAIFALFWFVLLFLAGITSSISIAQPVVTFLEDEFDITHDDSTKIFTVASFVLCLPAVILQAHGVIDELDFWGGTMFPVIFALVEVIMFAWIFGMNNAWDEIHHGADWHLPRFYRFVIQWITPGALILILGSFIWQNGANILSMSSVKDVDKPVVIFTRIYIGTIFVLISAMVWEAWRRRRAAVTAQSTETGA